MAERLKARVAQFHAELILRLGMEAAMTLAAGRIVRPLQLFLDVNTWMNLKLNHEAPMEKRHAPCHNQTRGAIEIPRLTHNQATQLSDLAQPFRENSRFRCAGQSGSGLLKIRRREKTRSS